MRRVILINIFVLVFLIAILEGGARTFLYFTQGSSTVGLPERTLYLSYQPFVMFGPDWDATFHSSLNEIKKKAHIHCVLLIGGSTAALYPKEILETAFRKKFPGHDFKVVNAAEGGYIARQEVIVAAIWGPALKPDIIISLDGANDMTHRIRMEKAGTFFLDAAYESALKQPLLTPLAHLLRHSQAAQGIERLQERKNIGSFEKYRDAIPVYISAQHSINILAKGLSATRLMVLQPFLSFKQPLSMEETGFKHYQYREAVLMKLYDRLNKDLDELAKQDNVRYLDGRFIFKGMESTIFSDDVHFVSGEGYRILAENMVNLLTENSLRHWNAN